MVIQRKAKVIKASEILNEKIRQLIALAKQQGFLTVQDINSHLPESVKKADEIENVINILENLEIDILDNEEAERQRQQDEVSESGNISVSSEESFEESVQVFAVPYSCCLIRRMHRKLCSSYISTSYADFLCR